MKRNIYLKILGGITAIVVLITLITIVIIEPWIGRKIESKFSDKNKDYIIEIGMVHLSMFAPGIELENIVLSPKQKDEGNHLLKGEIASIKLKGISLAKLLFKKNIEINERRSNE